MKNLRNVLSVFAFAFAVGAAFAFAPTKASMAMIDVEVDNGSCTPGQVSDQCTSQTSSNFCFVLGSKVVPDGASCDVAKLARPE